MEEVLTPKPAPEKLELSPVLRQILKRRQLTDPVELENFLWPDYDRHLHDPFMMKDMDKAVSRILMAAEKGESVVVYGDYDIDGITATAVMLEALGANGIMASPYIPDRFEEGYGLNQAALEGLKQGGADLVITVDCGVTAKAEAAWAKANGLDLIITDHHTVPAELPDVIAVLNPKRPDDDYPFEELAGVGVAFKLAQALQQKTGKPEVGREKWLLDLVALGTVCDVVPLLGENRVLARYGLIVLNKTRRVGLSALSAVAGVERQAINSQHLGFALGPRLNAAGRLEHASKSLDLLLTKESSMALDIAEELNRLNRQRQADLAVIVDEASIAAENFKDDPMLVMAGEGWSHGVVGIAASRMTEKFKRPALMMQIMGEIAKGSARSYGDFDLMPAFAAVADLFERYGGHRFAGGFTLKAKNIDELRRRLNEYAAGQTITAERDPVDYDSTLDETSWDLLQQLDLLEPFGRGNRVPLFSAKGIKLLSVQTVGKDAKHLKVRLDDGAGGVEGIAFGYGEMAASLHQGQLIDITYHIEKNVFNGRTSLQIRLRSIE